MLAHLSPSATAPNRNIRGEKQRWQESLIHDFRWVRVGACQDPNEPTLACQAGARSKIAVTLASPPDSPIGPSVSTNRLATEKWPPFVGVSSEVAPLGAKLGLNRLQGDLTLNQHFVHVADQESDPYPTMTPDTFVSHLPGYFS